MLTGPEELKAKVVDSLTGVYSATYTPHKAGTYSAAISYNGVPIFGSPYTTIVRPGRAYAALSVAACLDELPSDAPMEEAVDCAAAVGTAGEVALDTYF